MSHRHRHTSSVDPITKYYNSRNRVRPPTRKVFRNGKIEHRTTELHEALVSMGGNNKTHRLSDYEFTKQFAQEIGYLGSVGIGHFKDTVSSFCELCSDIISLF